MKDPFPGGIAGAKVSEVPDCAVLTIGTELLLGQIVDTNSVYLAQALAEAGVRIRQRLAVSDVLEEIVDALSLALDRCRLVITTGGLGPTLDDLTREAVAQVAGQPLELRPELMADIEAVFKRYGYRMADNNRRQAFVPRNATPIRNPVGTAPGFICEVGGKAVVCLPGVPRELKFLFPQTVLPWIKDFFGLPGQVLIYRTLKTVGIGESQVDRTIGDLITPGANPEVGLLASDGEIKIRMAVRACDPEEARARIAPLEEEIRRRLGKRIYGAEEETLEGVVAELLAAAGLSVSILESFSGGLAASRLLRLASFPLKEARVIPSIGAGDLLQDDARLSDLAGRFLSQTGADLALLILGCPEKVTDGWRVDARAVAVAEKGISKSFSWQMGGEYELLRYRGAITGLNTLRLALLERLSTGPPH